MYFKLFLCCMLTISREWKSSRRSYRLGYTVTIVFFAIKLLLSIYIYWTTSKHLQFNYWHSYSRTAMIGKLQLSQLPDDIWFTIIDKHYNDREKLKGIFMLYPAFLSFTCSLKLLQGIKVITADDILDNRNVIDSEHKLFALFQHTTSLRSISLYKIDYEVNWKYINVLIESAGSLLEVVDLSAAAVDDIDVKPLLQCPKLHSLFLKEVKGITGSAFRNTSAPIKNLNLSRCSGLTIQGIKEIFLVSTITNLNLDFVISLKNPNEGRLDFYETLLQELIQKSSLSKNLKSFSFVDGSLNLDDMYLILNSMKLLKDFTFSESVLLKYPLGSINLANIKLNRKDLRLSIKWWI